MKPGKHCGETGETLKETVKHREKHAETPVETVERVGRSPEKHNFEGITMIITGF